MIKNNSGSLAETLASQLTRGFLTIILILFLINRQIYAQNLSNSSQHSSLKLWYNKPSGKVWENALPIGNGRLGAMVYGNVETETIQMNEHTLWSGGPNRNDNPSALDSLEAIRKLFFEGKQKRMRSTA
ncbi:glycoside hydrolase N-terminal domain-containing protein [Desertivirga brevis]|uniref:glycoside hydrolase N-terminal domain-containing protein n=1 Tax=Desertivirga brevis TaxID=2810310 RepID=UPI001F617233|nr:glycoside hydrolase N-terminal domain-containing protein [Pedobacter sp. SYSU D00873]